MQRCSAGAAQGGGTFSQIYGSIVALIFGWLSHTVLLGTRQALERADEQQEEEQRFARHFEPLAQIH